MKVEFSRSLSGFNRQEVIDYIRKLTNEKHRAETDALENLNKLNDAEYRIEALKKELADEYSRKYMNTTIAQLEGYVDEVIEPDAIRRRVFEDIKAFEHKDKTTVAKRHGNIPL